MAGFQGMDESGRVTTLGRGGSDTTAVALAASLGADECHVYTDVEGVYTADPRLVPEARRLEHLTYEEMLEMSGLGSRVLQLRSVLFAEKYNVPLRVLSAFGSGPGTLISEEAENMEQATIAGIAHNRDEAQLTISGVTGHAGCCGAYSGANCRSTDRSRHDRAERRAGRYGGLHLHGAPQRLRQGSGDFGEELAANSVHERPAATGISSRFHWSGSGCARTRGSQAACSRLWLMRV